MQRIRLKERAFIGGAIHEAGDVVEIPDGMRGPIRTAIRTSHFEDTPLYELVDGPAPTTEPPLQVPAIAPSTSLNTLDGLVGLLSNSSATKNVLAELKQKYDELAALHEKVIAAGAAHSTKEAELNKREQELNGKTAGLAAAQQTVATTHAELSERAAKLDERTNTFNTLAKQRDAEHTKLRQALADETAATSKKLSARETAVLGREEAAVAKNEELLSRETNVKVREDKVAARISELTQHLRPL